MMSAQDRQNYLDLVCLSYQDGELSRLRFMAWIGALKIGHEEALRLEKKFRPKDAPPSRS